MSSVVARLSCSRALFSRALQPSKGVAARAVAPVLARSHVLSSQAFLRGAVGSKHSFFSAEKGNMNFYNSFHCSAMAADAEISPDNVDSVDGAAPAAPAAFENPGPVPNCKLYVGNLAWSVTDEDLKDAFQEYGTLADCEVIMDPSGRSRGFGFVTYSNVEEAQAAINALDQANFAERDIRVNFHAPRDPNAPRRERRPNRDSAHRLYVGNLPWSFDDFDLQDTFEEFGTIVDARVITDRETGRSRGFGFVTMTADDECDKAIEELDGSLCEGRNIRVNRAER